MPVNALAGSSILVLDEQPFSAYCLKVLLENAGAEVHAAARTGEALYCIDREQLSAAVLHLGESSKGRRQVIQRLARLKLPYVICKDSTDNSELLGASVLIKPILGAELVDTLQRLVAARRPLAPDAAHDVASKSAHGKSSNHIRVAERPARGST